MKLKCRGFSLIEVVLALGILVMVFSITSTLIIQVVNTAISARERTKAILLAQEEMAKQVAQIEGECNLPEATNQPITGTKNDFSFTISHNKEIDYGQGLGREDFMEVSITVNWYSREIFLEREQEITINQIVRT